MDQDNVIYTNCPNCKKTFELQADLIGSKGRCDDCQTKFIIQNNAEKPVAQTRVTVSSVKNTENAAKNQENKQSSNQKNALTNNQRSNLYKAKAKKSKAGLVLFFLFLLTTAGGGFYIWKQQELKKAKNQIASEKTQKTLTPSIPNNAPLSNQSSKNLTPLQETFPIQKQFERINIRQYRSTYSDVYNGWMPNAKEQAQAAKKWCHHLGPLGVRVLPHTQEHQKRPAFAAIVPDCLQTNEGKLGLTAAEVVSIAPDSPADGHLKIGDFIIGIEGEPLKSGDNYRPNWKIMHKSRRELQLMLGEKIDHAQERGDIRITVLRYPNKIHQVWSKKMKQTDGRHQITNIPVEAGDEVHLLVEPNGKNDWDHFAWLSPQLKGSAGTLNLAQANKASSATTGWGKISYEKNVAGNPLKEKGISVHSPSKIIYKVPKGYSKFSTAMQVTASKADLEAKILVVKKRQRLPIKRTTLWQGKGGNNKIPVQSFECVVPEGGYITLESNQFDNSIGGDGNKWLDVTLEGDFGTRSLFEIPWHSIYVGYGRPSLVKDKAYTEKKQTYQHILHLHAQGEATWKLPKGTKRIKGYFKASSYGKVQPKVHYTNSALPLTGEHRKKLVHLRFPIGKTGSYSKTYPKNCKKSELTAKRQTAWLAAQQQDNGSWNRLTGYTSSGWDTSWCGLALMSSGNAIYDEKIKKAAHYVAYENSSGNWTAERTMQLMFLSEYYLRTKDKTILAGLQNTYYQVIACCKTDYMAGHKVNGFGYGIAGQHYGTGHMALALALASRTPINIDKTLVKNVIQHAGEVCVNGTYAYGRGRRLARNEKRHYGGGNAMIGPGILGVLIGGGHTKAVQEYMERCAASLGDGDNSHATSTLAFVFSSLAMASADEEVFRKHMQSFKYKMTMDDCWEGGCLKSAFALDLQGGEGVTSTWIRTAGSIMVLNALKHNLAMSGKKEYHNPQTMEETPVSEWGGQIHSYYLRNWCIASELLGKKTPPALKKGIQRLSNLPRNIDLVPATKSIILELAPSLVKTLAADSSLKERQRAYAIELITGLDFKIYTDAKEGKQRVDLSINLPLHQLNWLEKNKNTLHSSHPLQLKSQITIKGENLSQAIKIQTNDTKGFNLDQGTKKWRKTQNLKNPTITEYKGTAQISFTLGKTKVEYTRPLYFNKKWAESNHINLRRLKLKLRIAPRAYYQSQPLMIAGKAFDCMYPREKMIPIKAPQKGRINPHEGDKVQVYLVSENFICAWMHGYRFEKMNQVEAITPKEITCITGTLTPEKSNIAALHDFDLKTYSKIGYTDRKAIIEYDFGKAKTINGLDIQLNRGGLIWIWYKKDEQWIPLRWDNFTPDTGFNPRFAKTKARYWRVEIKNSRSNQLQTLCFYHNKNRIAPHPIAVQAKDNNLLPPLSPR